MIRGIIFDCFGVLAVDVWLDFCSKLPPEADIEQASAITRAYDKGIISKNQFEAGVLAAVGSLPPVLEDLPAGQMIKNQTLLAFIEQLQPTYKLSILSNIYSTWITDALLTAQEQTYFSDMVLSYEVGLVKPEPAIYELACSRLGLQAHEVIMVDDRQSNVDGAIAAGLQGVLFTDTAACIAQLQRLLNPNN